MSSPMMLADLARALEGRRVLSVYVDGRETDPARQHDWRWVIDAGMREIRDRLRDADRRERDELDRCAVRLEAALDAHPGAIGAPGWAAFITSDGIQQQGSRSVPMPTLVDWREGGRLVPLVGALKEDQPVLVAVVDGRGAQSYEYRRGVLTRLGTFHVQASQGDVLHMGDAPREHFHPGTRGSTGADAAQLARRTRLTRMASEVAAALAARAGDDAWIALGGTPEGARAALAALPRRLERRARLAGEIGTRSTEHEIALAAAASSSALRRAHEASLVDTMLDRAGEHGRGAAGLRSTRHAADAVALQELLFTHTFAAGEPEEAERLLRAALAQGAAVELVTGHGAERLDAVCGGVGAVLRYAPASVALSEPVG